MQFYAGKLWWLKYYQLNATEAGKLIGTRVLVTDVFVSVSGRDARKCKMYR
jgi:hypothetical protein